VASESSSSIIQWRMRDKKRNAFNIKIQRGGGGEREREREREINKIGNFHQKNKKIK
jgi:hypothetical protein